MTETETSMTARPSSCGWCRDPYCTGDHSGDAAAEPWPDLSPVEDERGYWTITLEGGPATAANLAVALRTMARQSWVSRSASMTGFAGRLAIALEQAQFTPVREIEGESRDPAGED